MNCSLTRKLGSITVLNVLKAGLTTLMKTVDALTAPHLISTATPVTSMDAPNAIFSKVTPGTMNSVKLKENQTACYSLQMEIATGAREDQFLLTESV